MSLMQTYEALYYAYFVLAGGLLLACILSWKIGFRFTVAAVALLLALGGGAFIWRGDLLDRIGPERLTVRQAMLARPDDPWPRGSGHVPLGPLGSLETEKGYVEPGGSFSPAAGTFGVSFWIVAEDDRLVATSDDIPLDQTQARYVLSPAGETGITIETPHYTATWMVKGGAGFELALEPSPAAGQHVEIAIRGVGPAGGPLVMVERRSDRLQVGDQWTIGTLTSGMRVTAMGQEGDVGWTRPSKSAAVSARSPTGWAYARFAIPQEPVVLTLTRNAPIAADRLPRQRPPTLEGLESRFTTALLSQITTLQLGLVGTQTRPGEPLNYPLEWQRDGAYVVVALARCGQTALAEQLAMEFARKDFFGGFGAEADAPGLALWALAETSALVRRKEFDLAIWPHIQRKVELIMLMLRATSDVRHDFVGPSSPLKYSQEGELTLVAEPAHDGLIEGRMDWQRPIFYVNAVSYAGLMGAADIAERLGETAQAAAWQRAAADLRRAWIAAFENPDWAKRVHNDRTAISGLWPSEIAPVDGFAALMEQRWQEQEMDWSAPSYRPPWTYFVAAEAHQWVRLGRPDRAQTILDRLWALSPAPGLYTLWEGRGESGGLSRWKSFRGWTKPHHVTPHYWAAAEMLLTQLAMLAETRDGPDGWELVIGAGILAESISSKMAVSGIGTSHGFVDWSWDGVEVAVTVHGDPLPVRLGPSFPRSAKIKVAFLSPGE
jgi:hypothetical protein